LIAQNKMKVYLLLILFTLLGLSFGEDLKCYSCGFDSDDIEKECAVNPTINPTPKSCRRSDSCVTQVGYSKTESGTKKVEYRKCGKMSVQKNLDENNCKDETLNTLTVKTCFCQGELCNAPGSGLPVWVWIVIALVVVLIIGAIVALIIWKLKSRSGENSKEIPKTEPESVPLKSQEATKTDGEDQKSQEMPNDVP